MKKIRLFLQFSFMFGVKLILNSFVVCELNGDIKKKIYLKKGK